MLLNIHFFNSFAPIENNDVLSVCTETFSNEIFVRAKS